MLDRVEEAIATIREYLDKFDYEKLRNFPGPDPEAKLTTEDLNDFGDALEKLREVEKDARALVAAFDKADLAGIAALTESDHVATFAAFNIDAETEATFHEVDTGDTDPAMDTAMSDAADKFERRLDDAKPDLDQLKAKVETAVEELESLL